MPVAIEKWVGEPIIVLKPDAQVTLQELIDAWFRSMELAQTIEVTPYRIVDLRATHTPDRVVSMIKSIVKGAAGAPVDPVLNVAFVGSAPTAPSASASSDQSEAWFETLEDALNHVRALMGAPLLSS